MGVRLGRGLRRQRAALTGLCRLRAPVVWAALLLSVGLVSGFLGQLVPFSLLALCLCARALEDERPRLAAVAAAASLIEPHFGFPVCLGLALWMPRARPPLALLAGGAALLSFGLLGFERNLEYVRDVLPAHLASEVTNEEQYSLTHLLSLAGVPDALAIRLGTLSYAVTVALGALLGGRLVRRGAPASLYVLLPAAFAPLAGSFVHLQQMAFVIPALLVLLGTVAPANPWLGSALLLLAIPFGNFTFLFVTLPLALATVLVLRANSCACRGPVRSRSAWRRSSPCSRWLRAWAAVPTRTRPSPRFRAARSSPRRAGTR